MVDRNTVVHPRFDVGHVKAAETDYAGHCID